MPCAPFCTFCNSNTTTSCTGCVGGYTLVSNTCKPNNITGCTSSIWYSYDSKCFDCMNNYFSENGMTCKACSNIYAGCDKCNTIQYCTHCQPNYVLVQIYPYANTGGC
jgi:hypothetical protein